MPKVSTEHPDYGHLKPVLDAEGNFSYTPGAITVSPEPFLLEARNQLYMYGGSFGRPVVFLLDDWS